MNKIGKEISASISIAGNLTFLCFFIIFVLLPAYIGKKLIHDDSLMIRYIGRCIFVLPLEQVTNYFERNESDEDDPYAFG